MARPRLVTEEQVLALALAHFWRHGYVSTSIEDLVEATGAQRSTLYRSFGSKAGLFRAAVEQYSVSQAANIDLGCSPEAQLRAWFDAAVASSLDDGTPPGCLLINASAEHAALDPDLRDLVDAHLQLIESWFHATASQIRPDADPSELGAVLMGANYGVFLLGRRGAPEAQLRAVVDSALATVLGR